MKLCLLILILNYLMLPARKGLKIAFLIHLMSVQKCWKQLDCLLYRKASTLFKLWLDAFIVVVVVNYVTGCMLSAPYGHQCTGTQVALRPGVSNGSHIKHSNFAQCKVRNCSG